MTKSRGCLLAFIAIAFVGLVVVPEATAEPTTNGLQLCLDARGQQRTGDIDLVILFDDSASLQSVDPDGFRFDALEAFLAGLSFEGEDQRTKNVALVTFGARVEVLAELRPLDSGSIDQLLATARREATAEQRLTNYIQAVRTSVDLLVARPAENCPMIVWFTDGDHDLSDIRDPDVDRREALDLRESFCAEQALADRLRAASINTFVLMLEPPDWNPERLAASRDVIQVLTGDPRPAFAGASPEQRTPSGACDRPLAPQLGRVLPATQADQLPGLFADLSQELDGGQPLTNEACPYTIETVESVPMPDGHLIDWISLAGGVNQSQQPGIGLEDIEVVLAGAAHAADTYLEVLARTDRSTRFRVRDEAREQLEAGWQLRVVDAEGRCLRARSRPLAVRLSTIEPRLQPIDPTDLPVGLLAGDNLELRDRAGGRLLTFDEALRSPSVSGRLRVENGVVFAEDARLPVRIAVDGAPLLDDSCVALRIPGTETDLIRSAGGIEAPEVALDSTACVITPGTQDDGGRLEWSATVAALNDSDTACAIGTWQVHLNGEPQQGGGAVLPVAGAPVELRLSSQEPPPNQATDCTGLDLPPLTLEWSEQHAEIPVTVSVSWLQRSSPLLASLLSVPMVSAVVLLSLLVVRLMNALLLRPPAPEGLWGYRQSGHLEVDALGRVGIRWPTKDGAFEADQSMISRVRGDGRSELQVGEYHLRRRLPEWYRPWGEPGLVLVPPAQTSIAVGSPIPATSEATLQLGFRTAMVLITSDVRSAMSDGDVEVHVVVLVPRSDSVGAGDAIGEVVAHNSSDLARRLQDRRSVEDKSQSTGTTTSSPGVDGKSAPPPPKLRPTGRRDDPPGPDGTDRDW